MLSSTSFPAYAWGNSIWSPVRDVAVNGIAFSSAGGETTGADEGVATGAVDGAPAGAGDGAATGDCFVS